jgi:hypothetical protein
VTERDLPEMETVLVAMDLRPNKHIAFYSKISKLFSSYHSNYPFERAWET